MIIFTPSPQQNKGRFSMKHELTNSPTRSWHGGKLYGKGEALTIEQVFWDQPRLRAENNKLFYYKGRSRFKPLPKCKTRGYAKRLEYQVSEVARRENVAHNWVVIAEYREKLRKIKKVPRKT